MATKPLRSIQFPGLADTYTVAVTDTTLAIAGEPADAKATGDAIAAAAALATAADGKATVAGNVAADTLYDYDYSTDFDADLTTYMHATRHGMLVTLNGTVSSNPNGMWLFKLNGTAQYGSSADPVKAFSDPLVLTKGHTYRFRLRKLSGTIDAVEFKASVIKSGQTANQGTNTQTGNDYNNDFVYDSTWTGAHICVRFGRSAAASFTNVVLLATLEDLTPDIVPVSGTTPTITAKTGKRYVCGEVSEISFTPSASGLCEVRFTSGTTAAVLTLPQTVVMPDWWTGVEAGYTYEISIADGVYGAVMTWAT